MARTFKEDLFSRTGVIGKVYIAPADTHLYFVKNRGMSKGTVRIQYYGPGGESLRLASCELEIASCWDTRRVSLCLARKVRKSEGCH